MKKCYRCKQSKPIESFYRNHARKDGREYECKECTKTRKREWETRRNYKRRYGVSLEKVRELAEEQNWRCAICDKTCTITIGSNLGNGFHVDHCHTTKIIRGLLCSTCNTGLGKFKENKDALLKAVKYLENPPFNLSISI